MASSSDQIGSPPDGIVLSPSAPPTFQFHHNAGYTQMPTAYPPSLDPALQPPNVEQFRQVAALTESESVYEAPDEEEMVATKGGASETQPMSDLPPAYPGPPTGNEQQKNVWGTPGNVVTPVGHGNIYTQQQYPAGTMVSTAPPQMVFIAAPANTIPSMALHMTLACLTFWFCGWIFGAIAFFIVFCAKESYANGDQAGGNNLGTASLVLSAVGAMIGLIAYVILFLWVFEVIWD